MESLSQVEKEHITEALIKTQVNVYQTAKILRIARSTLYNKIRKHEIDLFKLAEWCHENSN
jgi:transcriptional regulator of acetoin/glycerol metabolism